MVVRATNRAKLRNPTRVPLPSAARMLRFIKSSMAARAAGRRNVDLTLNYTTGAGEVDGTVAGPMLEREMALKHEAASMYKHYQNMRKETLEPAPRLLPRESLTLRKARLEALSSFGQIPS